MALEEIARENRNFYAPRFEIEISDRKMSSEIIDVRIEEKINEGASFSLTINDEFDLSSQKFKWLDHPLIDVGKKITIKMGYSDNLITMIKGEITNLEPSFFAGELPTITVSGQDLSFKYFKRPSPERTFIEMKYSQIADALSSEAELDSVIDETGQFTSPIRKDNKMTYYDLLLKLSKEIGYEFRIDSRTMYFVKPKDEKKEIMTLELGKDIKSFQPSLNTSKLKTEVEVRGHSFKEPGKPIIGRASAGSERNQEPGRKTGSQIAQERYGEVKKVVTGVIVNSKQHADAMAQSILNDASDDLVEGQVDCIGIPQIRAGVTIKLEKMGKRFSGKNYIKETTHTINNSGYSTQFRVKRNAI